MIHKNIVRISEKLNNRNLLKICLQVTYFIDYYVISMYFPF